MTWILIGAAFVIFNLGYAAGWYFREGRWSTPQCPELYTVTECNLLGAPLREVKVRCFYKETHDGPCFNNRYDRPIYWEPKDE